MVRTYAAADDFPSGKLDENLIRIAVTARVRNCHRTPQLYTAVYRAAGVI